MEILRFDESDAPAPKRKRPSKAWLALSLVAALMGVGTAFASSSITIPTVSLGQGVAAVTNCDANVIVSPEATGSVSDNGEHPVFRTTSVTISGVGDTCSGSDFGLQVFKHFNTNSDEREDSSAIKAISCADLGITAVIRGTSTPVAFKCDIGTNTLWLNLETFASDATFKISTDFTNDIDYLTLVSSAHSDSRF
jgi:hypothetical protein